MVCLVLPADIHLPFYNLVVVSHGMVDGQYGPHCGWSISGCLVDDCLIVVTFACAVGGGSSIVSNFQCIFVDHVFPEGSIQLQLASWVPLCAMGIEVFSEDSATLQNDFQRFQLSHLSLSGLYLSLIIQVEDPHDCPLSPSVISCNDIIVCTSTKIRLLINDQAAPAPDCYSNCVSLIHFVCQKAEPDPSLFTLWL
jgi:hypothetical protein